MCYIYRYMKLYAFRFVCYAVALGCASAAHAAEFVWTGAAGSKWSDAANWTSGGAVATAAPGEADTALFDSTSCADCEIDAEKVKVLKIAEGYSGTLSLSTDFIVVDTYVQSNGVFTCGENTFTIGQGDGSGNTGKRGFFSLIGGVFNAPSTTMYWKPTNNSVVFLIESSATFNHNTGEFAPGGPNNSASIMKCNVTFYNVRFINGYRVCAAAGTTNRVLGTLTSQGAGFNSGGQSSQISSPSNWHSGGAGKNATLAVEGDLYFSNEHNLSNDRRGGAGVICLCGEKDQVIHSDDGMFPTLTVNKPAGTKVTCDIPDDKPLVIYGTGSGMNPHFFVESGTFVMPKAGMSFPNARYTDFFVTGGIIENPDAKLEFSIINGMFMDVNYAIRDLSISGAILTSYKELSIKGNLEIGAGGGLYSGGSGDSAGYFRMCGEGDQRFKNVSEKTTVGSGSAWTGKFHIDKPSGKLYLDNPLHAKYVKICRDAHLVFQIAETAGDTTAIGDGGWNEPLVKADARNLSFEPGINVTLEVAGRLRDDYPKKWNVFGWTYALEDYDSVSFDFMLPSGAFKPKLIKDEDNKNVYLEYRYANGMKIILR